MNTNIIQINEPLNFQQVVELVWQLPHRDKVKLNEMLKNETMQVPENDNISTHLASEKVLAKDWLLKDEEEAWKDL